MKLSIAVATYLLAFLAVNSTFAAVTMVSDNIYDVGKIYYSNKSGTKNDSVMCWAAASSNALQYWQDTYGSGEAPNGLLSYSATPAGTNYLNIYNNFLTNWTNGSGYAYNAFSWWLQGGIALKGGSSTSASAGYMQDIFGSVTPSYDSRDEKSCFHSVMVDNMVEHPDDHSYYSKVPKFNQLQNALDRAFGGAGQAVVLNVCHTDYTGAHAITCWGYEKNEDGSYSLLMTDSDDSRYGAFVLTATAMSDAEKGDYIKLETHDGSSWYSLGNYIVYDLVSIKTPEGVVKDAPGAAVEESGSVFKTNTTLTKAVSDGYGFIIGGGKYKDDATGVNAATIFTTTAEAKLTAHAAYSKYYVGLEVKEGGMALLHGGLEVSGFGNHGVLATGHLYADGGVVDIQNNAYSNSGEESNGGGGVMADSYVEIKNASAVTVSNNSSSYTSETGYNNAQLTGGGGIFSRDSVSLLNNGAVKVENNQASGDWMLGGGIGAEYSKVCGNESVSISGNTLTTEKYNKAAGGAVGGFENFVDGNGSVVLSGNTVNVNHNATSIWVKQGGGWIQTSAVDDTALGGALATPMYWPVTYIPDATWTGHADHILPELSLSGNGDVTVAGNKAVASNQVEHQKASALGGGIGLDNTLCSCGKMLGTRASISGNTGEVRFENNRAEAHVLFRNMTAEALGGAIYVSEASTLDMSGAEQRLIFSGNSTAAISDYGFVATLVSRGGAVYNAGKLDMSGNGSILFTGNSAQEGNDIFNAAGALCNISSNGSVVFKADAPATGLSVAVQNEGNLYVSAASGHTVLFENTALSTAGEGKTYIGQDAVCSTEDCSGQVLFTASSGAQTAVEAKSVDVPAMVQNLVLSAELIARAGDSGYGSLDNTMVTAVGELTMQHVSLNTTDAILAAGEDYISMDDVVITLNKGDLMEDNRTFDLTGMFRGNYNLDSVTFDLTDESLADLVPENLVFDMSTAYALPEFRNVNVLWNADPIPVAQVGMLVLAGAPIPEPATGTLGLLALAALATRRRRR